MDSRFHLKLKFSIYGKEYPWDCSLNWSAEPGEIDRRITEFFLSAHDEAFEAWSEKNETAQAKREKEETEARERAELKRLRDKYRDA